MDRYYSENLSAHRLKRCYDIAPPRVQQYLDAEVQYISSRIDSGDTVLELGCGYGRALALLAARTNIAIGIDTSYDSLKLGRELFPNLKNLTFLQMNGVHLAFPDDCFDVTLCIQNGLSAFKVDQLDLVGESVRVTRSGGIALFSSYADKFWDDRLEWFQMQADEGLLGEIDLDATGDGIIVCRDGFRAMTIKPDDFIQLASHLGLEAKITEIDESSIFCEITV